MSDVSSPSVDLRDERGAELRIGLDSSPHGAGEFFSLSVTLIFRLIDKVVNVTKK
jgi:hypothetical protein